MFAAFNLYKYACVFFCHNFIITVAKPPGFATTSAPVTPLTFHFAFNDSKNVVRPRSNVADSWGGTMASADLWLHGYLTHAWADYHVKVNVWGLNYIKRVRYLIIFKKNIYFCLPYTVQFNNPKYYTSQYSTVWGYDGRAVLR